MNVLSLFDGISCGQVALKRSGIKVDKYYASEIDKYAIQVTQKNHPNTIQLGNVSDVKAENLPNIDIMLFGTPCQPYSVSGKGLGLEDFRGKLIYEVFRLLKEVRPKYFLFENVKGLFSGKNKLIFEFMLEEFCKCGYRVDFDIINSAKLSAQNRERLYVFGEYINLKEEWKDFNGYKVSSFGKVIGIRGNVLKPRLDKDGYERITLFYNGKRKDFRTNRLIAEVFLPNPNSLKLVNHLNCKVTDNRVFNLKWVTDKENQIYGSLLANIKRGVVWHKVKKQFIVTFYNKNNKQIHLGYYTNKKEAYDIYFKKYTEEHHINPWSKINEFKKEILNNDKIYPNYFSYIKQPCDLNIYLKDVLESGVVDRDKSYCIDSNYFKGGNLKQYFEKSRRQLVFDKPERVGSIGKGGQGQRIYATNGKSVTLSALGGGQGAKTGLYAVAQRGRNIVNGKRKDITGHKTEQRFETSFSNKSNCLTSVAKDSYILELNTEDYIVRKLTPIECERLQTLPDNYTEGISNSQRYKALGNGWTVDVISHILKELK